MRVDIIPKTRPGKLSTWLIVAFIVFFGLFWLFVAGGQRGGAKFLSNLYLAVPMLLAGISGISAFIAGIIGVIASRERSIFVYLAMIIGLIVLIFVLGEIIFPH